MTAVSVVDYGIGNIQSVVNACRRVGVVPAVARTGDELAAQRPDRIILPGVGAIGEALRLLRQRELDTALGEHVLDRCVPFLGICVGLQMLVETCEEFGAHEGLGWIPGAVRRLAPEGSGVRLPHVGWNTVSAEPDDPLFRGIEDEHFYFVHTCAAERVDDYVIGWTDYAGPFVSAVRRDHIAGVQFHPEKSSAAGEALLKCFLDA